MFRYLNQTHFPLISYQPCTLISVASVEFEGYEMLSMRV